MFVVCCWWLCVARCLFFVVCCSMRVHGCCGLEVFVVFVCCVIARCCASSCVVRCSLFVVRSLLLVVCRLLFVVCMCFVCCLLLFVVECVWLLIVVGCSLIVGRR